MPDFPPLKKGKLRANDAAKKTSVKKNKASKKKRRLVRYVRLEHKRHRPAHSHDATTGAALLMSTELKVAQDMIKTGHLPNLAGARCSSCEVGTLGPLRRDVSKGAAGYRCMSQACRTLVRPHANHPIFSVAKGASAAPLPMQAFIL